MRPLGYDFVYQLHDKPGLKRWVHVLGNDESPEAICEKTMEMLKCEGWGMEEAVADATDWDDEE